MEDIENQVLAAFDRTTARHKRRTGEIYPTGVYVCMDSDWESGEIVEKGIYPNGPPVLATFTFDKLDRPRIRLR